MANLVIFAICGSDGERVVFASVESQQLRYHQMIFDQRAKTHKNLVRWYKRKVAAKAISTEGASGAGPEALIAAYKKIAHHAEAAGMTTVSICRHTNSCRARTHKREHRHRHTHTHSCMTL
eukprot:COSAG02_NODE_2055_length_9982_cov_3.771426_4_plen_121_part_00